MMKEATLLHTNIKVVVKEIKHFQGTADKTLDGIKQVGPLAAPPACLPSLSCPLMPACQQPAVLDTTAHHSSDGCWPRTCKAGAPPSLVARMSRLQAT